MRLGVISDTHGVLRDEVIEKLQSCDYIIHAGDVGGKEITPNLICFSFFYLIVFLLLFLL